MLSPIHKLFGESCPAVCTHVSWHRLLGLASHKPYWLILQVVLKCGEWVFISGGTKGQCMVKSYVLG